MDAQQPLDTRTLALMKRIISENVRPYYKQLVIALFFMVMSSAAAAASMWLLKPVINDIFVDRNADMLWPLGFAIIFVFLTKGLAQYGQATAMSWLGLRIVADLQNGLYDHLMRMDLAFFHATPSGTLVSRFTNDIGLMRMTATKVLTSFGKDMTMLIGMVVVMVATNWELALVALVVFPLTLGPVIQLGKRIRKVTVNSQAKLGLLINLLNQTIGGIRHVKAYGMENYERRRIRELTEAIRRLFLKSERIKAMNSPLMEGVSGFAIALIIVYGGYQVIEGLKTPGDFFAFLGAAFMVYEPAKRLAHLNAEMQGGLAGAERLYKLQDIQPLITDVKDAPALNLKDGHIRFEKVNFAYEDDKTALEALNIDIPPGKTVALVGPSGAGKSTILNLVPRFYDVDQGQITIDGQDISKVALSSLRHHCSLVSQEVVLFDETVRANITYGRFEASEEEVVQAAKMAAAHDFIMELPEGYDTLIGEDGVKLSGGQRQRLSIARAILKNAHILLLDEATSALDTESERKVQEAITQLMKGKTSLVIAHRLSTIVDADLIYVIDQGRVIESGSHQALLNKDGIYARLYALQFSESGDPVS